MGANIDTQDYVYDNLPPISLAAENGHFQVVDFLLKNGANVNIPSVNGPLVRAANAGHFQIVQFLLEHGANIYNFSLLSLSLTLAANKGTCKAPTLGVRVENCQIVKSIF